MRFHSGRSVDDVSGLFGRLFVIAGILILLGSFSSASTIQEEHETIELGETTTVTVDLNYSEFTAQQVSLLVPSSHNPYDIEAVDTDGTIPCQLRSQYGKEIICDPGEESGRYSVSITYRTEDPSFSGTEGQPFEAYTHLQRILVPTDRYRLDVILPEGYGIVEDGSVTPYSPDGATTGSEGRRIFVRWEQDDVSLGDAFEFQVRYQELNVFENVVPGNTAFLVAFIVILIAISVAIYVRSRKDRDTIAAIMPVLKEDEQEVMRYMIDNGGECEQRSLVMDLSYSKAKISRLVKDLVERNLIEKIKEGRMNRLVLKKEVGDIDVSRG